MAHSISRCSLVPRCTRWLRNHVLVLVLIENEIPRRSCVCKGKRLCYDSAVL